MPGRDDYLILAKHIKKELDEKGHAFQSYDRTALTQLLRKISGDVNTRIKSGIAREIEDMFRDQGLRVFPTLSETTTGDVVRIWRAGTHAAELLDLILHPGARSDAELGEISRKTKGRWVWEQYDRKDHNEAPLSATGRRRSPQ